MAKNFSREFADKLLDKLSTDDGFRDLFKKDARAALRQLGHETPEAEVGVKGSDPVLCLGDGLSLASKDEIKSARERLQTQLSSSVFHYDATT